MATAYRTTQRRDIFAGLTNMFGPLDPKIRARLKSVMRTPNARTWNDAHGIILRGEGKHLTLWQAILAVDPTFPRVGPATDSERSWSRIPDPMLIARAIRYAREEA